MTFLFQAWRNFARNLKRYRVVLVALLFSMAVLTFVFGTLLGLRGAVRGKASRYFAGDLVVLGFAGNQSSVIAPSDIAKVEAAIHQVSDPRAVSYRSTYYDIYNIELFFAGYYKRQRRLVGVEWDREAPVLGEFLFQEGGVPDAGDLSAILISDAAAQDLRARVGDELLVSIRSDRGRANTANVIVRGIYTESSFFGYTGYLHRATLNSLREAPLGNVNEIGLYLDQRDLSRETEIARALTASMNDAGLLITPVITTRQEYSGATSVLRDGKTYGVVTLSAQLDEITDLISAMTIVAGVVIALFLGIVVVGVSNTWTMVVHERRREIGTVRALGMHRGAATTLFLTEALYLGLSGGILGSVLGVLLLAAINALVTFPPNAATTLFLTQGQLMWRLPPWLIGVVVALSMGASVFGALRGAIRSALVSPVEVLR